MTGEPAGKLRTWAGPAATLFSVPFILVPKLKGKTRVSLSCSIVRQIAESHFFLLLTYTYIHNIAHRLELLLVTSHPAENLCPHSFLHFSISDWVNANMQTHSTSKNYVLKEFTGIQSVLLAAVVPFATAFCIMAIGTNKTCVDVKWLTSTCCFL